MTLIKTLVPRLSCRGCGRTDLTAEDFPRDRSKPSGRHSRCLSCKYQTRLPKPPPPVDHQARIRRDALVELVKRHRLEFDDIVSFYRAEHARVEYGIGRKGSWVNAARAVTAAVR